MMKRFRREWQAFASVLALLCGATMQVVFAADFEGAISVGEGKDKKTCKADGKEDKKFLFDTGADVTIISRKCAKALGLLNEKGEPVGHKGALDVEGTPSKLWCYEKVSIAAKDSDGNECAQPITRVYVSQKDGDYVDTNILGKDWQKANKTADQANPEKTIWPGKVERIKKICVKSVDSATNFEQEVLPNISLTGSQGGSLLDMTFLNDSPYSFIPQSVAEELASLTGSIDLFSLAPDVWNRLLHAGMNITEQKVFDTIQISGFDIGFGTVNAPLTLLVSNDSNSAFGVLGSDLFRSPNPDETIVYYQSPELSALGVVPEPSAQVFIGIGIIGSLGGYVRCWRRRGCAHR